MNISDPGRAEALFYEALELPPEQRAVFLDRFCEEDPDVRAEVEDLLGAYERGGDRLDANFDGLRDPVTRAKPEEPGDRIDDFRLLEQIGEGGFGTVWVAEQERPVRRRVALKIIKLGMDTKGVIARFEQERQALAMMDHPNIAKVFDAGTTSTGRPYFVMELVRGVRITDYCDEAQLSTRERLELFIQVCSAVQHAHQKGIIHRDLKPSNILVTLHDTIAVPKVIDFGIAKATQQQRLTDLTIYTHYEQMIGTPLYMSPEQAQMSGLDIDTRSDIYSLGVLLYELLTGQTPFPAEQLLNAGIDEMRRVIREQEPQKPSTVVSTLERPARATLAMRRQSDAAKLIGQIRGDLDWIVMKALEKDRARRYGTATEFARDLERHLADEPVSARAPGKLYRFRRFVRRNKLVFAAGAITTMALIAAATVSTWMYFNEKEALGRALGAEEAQRREKQIAEKEANKSWQVAKFLTDMLEGVGPSVALGSDTKLLREILDRTAERVGEDLKDQPEVEADLRSIIGDAYLDIAEFQKAWTMEERALALRRKRFGNEHPDIATSLYKKATNLWYQGRHAEAEKLHREALAMRQKLLGLEHRYSIISLENLGKPLMSQRKLEEAEAVTRQALEMAVRTFPSGDRDLAGFRNDLAAILSERGKLEEAERLSREALELMTKNLGEEHPDVAASLNNLALILQRRGDLPQAGRLLAQSVTLAKKLYGEHPDTATTLTNLADVLIRTGKPAEATPLVQEALAIERKVHGNDHKSTQQALYEVGRALRAERKFAEAEVAWRERLHRTRSIFGEEHPTHVTALRHLSEVLRDAGKLQEAESVARDALRLGPKAFGEDPEKMGTLYGNLASALQKQSKLAEAESIYRQAIESQAPSTHSEELESLEAQLAVNLQMQKRFAEAETLHREVIAMRVKRFGPEGESVLTSRAQLGQLLTTWTSDEHATLPANAPDGTADKRRSLRERIQRAEAELRDVWVIRNRVTPDYWRLHDVAIRLGRALVVAATMDGATAPAGSNPSLEEAEQLLLGGYHALRENSSVESQYHRGAVENLVQLYRLRQQPEKKAEWEKTLAGYRTTAKPAR